MGSCPGSCGFGKVRLQEKVQIGHIYSKVLSVMEGFLEEVVNEFGVRVFGDRKDDLWGRLGYPTPSRWGSLPLKGGQTPCCFFAHSYPPAT